MPDNLAEAARYALLRRLAPAIRHRMVGQLHPIGLIAETAARRVQAGASEQAKVHESIAKIGDLSRSAMESFTGLITWLAPEDRASAAIGEGIGECLELLRAECDMRGFSIENQVGAPDTRVSLAALRNVFASALIATIDSAPGPAELSLSADASGERVLLSILARPAPDAVAVAGGGAYRSLGWNDVRALAQAESVKLSRHGKRVDISFPISRAADAAAQAR